jgi:hypothetical protein
MAPVPDDAFADLLANRSRAAFADLVADLWAARGFEVTHEGNHLVIDGERPLVPVVDGADERPAVVDLAGDGQSDPLVVSDTPATDSGVVGPVELRRMLLYDVPRDRATAVFEAHFDRPLDGDWSGDEREATTLAGAERDASGSQRPVGPGALSPRLAAATVVVLFVALAVAGGVTGPGVDSLTADAPGGDPAGTPLLDPGTTTGRLTSTGADAAAADGPGPSTATPMDGDYPPGVSASGVQDAGILATAHARGVMGTPYELVVTYREYREGTLTGEVRETIRVLDRTVYVTRVDVTGQIIAEPPAISVAETYADGSVRYERRLRSDGMVYTVRDAQALQGGQSPFASRVERLVRTRLSAQETRVVGSIRRDGVRQFLVIFRGTQRVGSARVDEHGVVHALQWRFTPEDHPRVTAEVVVRYDFGNVTVTPPHWVDEARNATRD